VKEVREFFAPRVCRRVSNLDASIRELIVDGLTLICGTQQSHFAPAAGHQLTGCVNDSLVMPFSKRDPTTNGRSSGLEPFKKPHSSSPAAIVTQQGSPNREGTAPEKGCEGYLYPPEQPCALHLTSRS
jgi:hypothetical protein